MEIALRGSRSYRAWISLLLVFTVAGLAVYLWGQFSNSEMSGLSRDVVWGLYIANYTFMVGVAASAVVVVLPYYLHDQKEFARAVVLGEFLAVAAVAAAILFIMVDLGQPARALNIVLYPTLSSPFFYNVVVLPGYLLLNLAIGWLTLDAGRKGLAPPGWVKPLILLSIPWAISIHTLTAFVYGGIVARPLWNTAVMAPRFLASAFASGPALLIVMTFVLRRFARFDVGAGAVQKLAVIVAYAMVANLFLILVELLTVLYGGIPGQVSHLQYLYLGLEGHYGMVPWMWASLLLGLVGLALLLRPARRRDERALVAACGAIFVSIWIDKGLGLVVGGSIPSVLGQITEYAPTLAEVVVSAAVCAAGLLVVSVFYRVVVAFRAES